MHPEFSKIKNSALRLIARRDHSAHELKRKLQTKYKFSDADFSALLEYLKELGYLADEKLLAQRWTKQWRDQGRGRYWIAGKLKEKGLPPVTLSEDAEELEAAKLFALKKLRGRDMKNLDKNEKAKLARNMIARGFSSSIVAMVLLERKGSFLE